MIQETWWVLSIKTPGKLKIFLDIFWVLFQALFDVAKTAHHKNRLFKKPLGKKFAETGTWAYAPWLQNLFPLYCSCVPDEATVCAHVHRVASHKTHQQLVAWQGNYRVFKVWWENDSVCSGCVSSAHLVALTFNIHLEILLYCHKYLFRVITVTLQQGHTSLHITLPLPRETLSVANKANKQPKQPARMHSVDLRVWKKACEAWKQLHTRESETLRLVHKYSDWLDDSKLINGETNPISW